MSSHRRTSRSRRRKGAAPKPTTVRPMLEALEDRTIPTVTTTGIPSWVEQGPGPISGGQVVGLETQNNIVAGAIQAIAAHPTNANIVYVGGVNGGIWRTTNATAAAGPNWTLQGEQLPSQAISSLAFSPLDNTNNTLFAGTGGFATNGLHSGQAVGVYKTTDGGTTWNPLLPTEQAKFGGSSVATVLPTALLDPTTNGQVVFAATYGTRGLLRSADGGATWESISGKAGSGLPGFAAVTDVVADPVSTTTYYAAVANTSFNPTVERGVYRSSDGGLTWARIDASIPAATLAAADRIDLAMSRLSSSPLYAAVIQPNSDRNNDGSPDGTRLVAIFRTADPRAATPTWTNIGTPATFENDNTDNDDDGSVDEAGEPVGLHAGRQGLRNFSMAVVPSNPNSIIVGGDRQPTANPLVNAAGLGNFVGRLFQLNGDLTWTQVVGNNAAGTAPHADSRFMAFDAADNLLEGDDGGLFKLTSPHTTARRWSTLNGNLRVSEVYSVGYDPLNNVAFIGTQDNGSAEQRRQANNGVDNDGDGTADDLDEKLSWQAIFGGDGGTQGGALDGNSFVRYSMGNNFQTFLRRTFGSGDDTPDDTDRPQFLLLRSADRKESGFVLIPYVINAIDPSRLLVGYNHLYESGTRGSFVRRVLESDGTFFTAVAFGGREDPEGDGTFVNQPNVAYASRPGRIAARGPTGDFVERAVPGMGTAHTIVIDPNNWRIAYASDRADVFRTVDGGATWTVLSHPPFGRAGESNTLLSLELVKASDGSDVLLVGTDRGVYRTINPSPTSRWTQFGQGLPNIAVPDLHYDRTDDVLLAATFGRGVWSIPLAASKVAELGEVLVQGNDAAASPDAIRVALRAGNPFLLDIFLNSATPTRTVPTASVHQIEVLGRRGADVLTIDLSNRGFSPAFGISFDGGTDAEQDSVQLTQGAAVPFAAETNGPIPGAGNRVTVRGDARTLDLFLQNVDAPIGGNLPVTQAVASAPALSPALAELGTWLGNLRFTGLAAELPGLGTSLGSALAGAPVNLPRRPGDPAPPLVGAGANADGIFNQSEVGKPAGRQASSILQRLIQTGIGAFSFQDIGTSIATLTQLQSRLDGLDDIPGNVTLTQENGVVRFDVQIRKRLDGEALLDADLLGGAISLNGVVAVSADVDAHLIFGMDNGGFFLDAESASGPEIVVSNISGSVRGEGKVGFLGVQLTTGTLTFDEDVELRVDLTDPGTGTADDGLIRLTDFTTDITQLVSAEVVGEGNDADGQQDVELAATFQVSAFNFPLLTDLRLMLQWQSANDLSSATVTAASGSNGQRLLDFLSLNADQVVAGVNNLADLFQQATGTDLLATKIPLLNKSLDEVINGAPQDVAVDNSAVAQLGPVTTTNGVSTFQVLLTDTDLLRQGVAVGQTIRYRSGNQDVTGTIDAVDLTGFTVRFASTLTQPPSAANPLFRIVRPGGLEAMLAGLTSGLPQLPTLEDLIDELADRTGLDFLSNVTVSGSLNDLVVEIPLVYDPDAFTYTNRLDFGSRIPGLGFDASGDVLVTIDPKFQLRIGVRLAPNLELAQRFFIVNNSEPEIELTVLAQLDNPNVTGTLGILDVRLSETTGGTNKGVDFNGAFRLNLAGGGADNRITLDEIGLNLFQPSVDVRLDIDGLRVSADVGTSNLGQLTLSLDGESANGPGHVTTLSGFGNLLSGIVVTGESNFSSFANITPQMVLALLDQVVVKLTELGAGGVFQRQLPLINKSIADLIDLGQEFAARLATGDPVNDLQVATLKGLQNFLNSRLGNTGLVITLNPGEVRVGFNFNPTFTRTFPFNFDFGSGGFSPTVSGQGAVTLAGGINSRLTLGISTAPNVEFADRVYFITDQHPTGQTGEVRVVATLNTGYDLNNDGNFVSDPNEAPPLNFEAAVGPVSLQVANARALIQLDATLDLKGGTANGETNDASRLTFREIVTDPTNTVFDGTFGGSAQAILPLDGDGGGVSNNPATLSAGDARITLAGRLNDLGNIVFDDEPVYHVVNGPSATSAVDITDPLTAAELNPSTDPGKFRIFVENLDGLILDGVLSFETVIEGLEKFIEWGQELLDINVLDYQLPLIGKDLRDALDFFGSMEGGLGQLLQRLNTSSVSLGTSIRQTAVQGAFNFLAGALADVPGVRPIGDANQDGRVDDTLVGNLLEKSDDLIRFERGAVIGTVTTTDANSNITNLVGADFTLVSTINLDFGGEGVAAGDVVRYTATDGTQATGRVKVVDSLRPTEVVIARDNSSKVPDTARNVTIDVREVIGATFLIKFVPHVERSFDLNLGLDFLNFRSDVDVTFSADLELTLGFGVNKIDGFFLKTDFSDVMIEDPNNPNGSLIANGNGPELKVTASVDLAAAANAVGFQLGFLGVRNSEAITAANNFLDVSFSTDLRHPQDANAKPEDVRGKLRLNDLLNFTAIPSYIDAGLGVRAKLDIPLTVDISANPDLPSISGRFVLDWAQLNPDGTLAMAGGTTVPFDVFEGVPAPKIKLQDVSLDVGSVLTKIAGPILQRIQQNNPLGPIIDVMSEPLPVLNKSLFQLLITENTLLSESTRRAATFLFTIASFVSDAAKQAEAAENLRINFGSISLSRQTVAGTAGSGTMEQVAGGTQTMVTLDPGSTETGTANTSGGTTPVASIPGSGLPLVGEFFQKLGDLGILFPVLDFSNVGKLLTGGIVDLVVFNLPELELGKSFQISFPLFNFGIPYVADVNISAFFGGGFELRVNLSAGFDTRGLRLRKDDPQGGHSILDGIYLGDFDPGDDGIIQPTDQERPELAFEAFVNAGIDAQVRLIGLPLGRATGSAGITGTIGIDLNDDNEVPNTDVVILGDERSMADRHDGRLYLDEIATIVDTTGTPIGLFDLVGKVAAELKIRLQVALLLDREFSFDWTLAEFELTANNALPPGGADLANLATISGANRRLLLTSDPSEDIAFRRGRAGSNHPNGDNVQILLVDKDQNPDDGVAQATVPNNTATVAAVGSDQFRVTRTGSRFLEQGVALGQRVTFVAGGLNRRGTITDVTDDAITVRPDTQPVVLPAPGSMDFTVLSGRETLRVRKSGISEDFGPGETGNNLISNIGNITEISTFFTGSNALYALDGLGAGNDAVTVDPLYSGAVRLDGGAGNDTLTGARGNDMLVGNAGDDQLDGGSGPDGTSGNDTLLGGGGSDLLNGRGGNDRIVGDFDTTVEAIPASSVTAAEQREGNDSISGGDGNDTIWGDNKGSATNADGPAPVVSTPPVLPSYIVNVLPPALVATLSSAQVRASDVILAGGDSDTVFASSGNDRVEADDVEPAAGSVAGNDSVQGGDGNDTLLGLGGNDSLAGGKGGDFIVGGLGDDQLFAGDTSRTTTATDLGTETLLGDTESAGAAAGGNDLLDGTDAAQLIARGGAGNDSIVGGVGPDQLAGNAGNDAIVGGPENDTLDGGAGNDDLIGGSGSIDRPTGVVGYDFLPTGFTATDRRADGADTLITAEDSDVVDSGSGRIFADRSTSPSSAEVAGLADTFNVSRLDSGINYNLDSNVVTQVGPNDSVFVVRRFENFVGTPFNDNLDIDAINAPRSVTGGSAGIDALTFDAKGAAVTLGKTSILATGLQPISTTGFETITLVNATGPITLLGDDLDNTLTLGQSNGVLTYQFDGGAVVTLNRPAGSSITVNLGVGDDRLNVPGSNLSLPGGGTLTYNGGAGSDQVLVSADADFTLTNAAVTSSGGGTITLASGTVERATLTGGAGNNTFTISNWTGQANVNGQGGTDAARFTGTSGQSATYRPDQTTANDSRLVVGANTQFFTGLEALQVQGLGSLTVSPDGSADNLTLAPGTGSGNQPATVVTGTTANTAVTPLTFFGIPAVTVDVGATDVAASPNDAVTVSAGALVAQGLQNFTVRTGLGNDTLTVNATSYTLPVAGGSFLFDGGAGAADRIATSADVDFTLTNAALSSSSGGTITLQSGTVEEAALTGGLGINRFTLTGYSGTATLNGAAGNDLVSLNLTGGTVNTVDTLGVSGNVTINAASTQARINGSLSLATTRTFTVTNGGGLGGFALDLGAVVSGSGGLTKAGTGSMQLSGNNTYTGTTTVNAGSLFINGSQPSSPVSVTAGRLGGTGTIGNLTVTDGVFSPGVNRGVLTVNGNVTFGSNATVEFDLSTPTDFDQLRVVNNTQDINLGNAVFLFGLTNDTDVGDTFRIIDNDDNRASDTIDTFFVEPGLDGGPITDQEIISVDTGEDFEGPRVRVRINQTGSLGTGNDYTLVHIATSQFPNRTITSPVAVGATVVVSGTIGEPEPEDPFLLDVTWGDGSAVESFTFPPGSHGQPVRLEHAYAEPGQYTVHLAWRDDNGGGNQADLQVLVLPTDDPEQRFVGHLYRDLLGREADLGGLGLFDGQLAQGVSREEVIRQFLDSLEYRTKQIEEAYQSILGRAADATGLDAALTFLANGGSEVQLRASLLGSAEFFARAGGTNADFVAALYRTALGRRADAGGAAAAEFQLALGTSREVLAGMVLTSAEARRTQVAGWYTDYLERPADEVGLAFFSSQLGAAADEDALLGRLLAADEYFVRN